MTSFKSVGQFPYEAASSPKVGSENALRRSLDLLVAIIKVIVFSFPIFMKLLKNIFFGRDKKQIRGWTVLITGGAHGIGEALGTAFSKKGCNIVIADVDESGGQSAAKQLREKYGVKAVAYKVDVTNYNRLLDLKEEIERDIGPVDILVNNAGLMPIFSWYEGTQEEIDKIVAVNITSHIYTVRVFLKGMVERKYGHVVTMSSIAALHPAGNAVVYSASKFAVTGFTRALEQEIRQEGYNNIKFTTVHPYFVATRKDLMDCLKLTIPAISPKHVAESTVKGVLTNSPVVIIPSYFKGLLNLEKLLPVGVQNLVRDYVFKEKEVLIKDNPRPKIISNT